MKKVKLSELWNSVDEALQGDRVAGIKFAVIEAHKILDNTLISQGYPGKNIEKRLYWAGYSLEDEGGIKSALDKRDEILRNFDFSLSDLEAADIVALYKKIVHEIATQEPFGWQRKIRAFYKVYISPKSVYTWRNLAIAFGILLAVKVLNYTAVGKDITEAVVKVADVLLSWITVVVIILVSVVIIAATNYRENKTKIRIKEENS
jgi:hypothetical protein